MQILQAGPSQATLRQQAMDQGMNNLVSGIGTYEKAKNERDATLRQQAMQLGQARMDLQKMGYDTTKLSDDQIAAGIGIQKPAEIGLKSLFSKQEASQANPGDIFSGPRTQDWTDKQNLEKAKYARDMRNDALDEKVKMAQIGGIYADNKKKLAEANKLSAEASTPGMLKNLNAEEKNKVGGIASGIRALRNMHESLKDNYGPQYISSNTPLIGGMVSDTPYTENERVLNEVVGRLQSGGAIGVDEGNRFRDMGPRAGDDAAARKRKLQDQMAFLENKLNAYGMKPEHLQQLGFDTNASYTAKNKDMNVGNTASAGGNSGPWAKYGKK
ncbi:MAG: hypothetical protein AB7I27_00350 [Bacteriovoracaceae bacterium]